MLKYPIVWVSLRPFLRGLAIQREKDGLSVLFHPDLSGKEENNANF